MTNKYLFLLTMFLMFRCSTYTSKEATAKDRDVLAELPKGTGPLKLSDLINGQWRTNGNEGTVPNWLEFDSTTMQFYSWLDDEPRPIISSGSYRILSDTILELSYAAYNETERFGFDSISTDYLDVWSTIVSAGNLIYSRSSYKSPEDRVIFFHLSDREFDSIEALPDYQGAYEASSDFGFYVSKVIDSLAETSVQTEVTTQRFIHVKATKFDKFDHYGYGVALIKRDSVLVEGGVMTDIEYFQLISDFFN